MSSIEHDHPHEAAESPADYVAVEGSAGSATDNGGPVKTDLPIKDGPDVQHHARSNSVKKPITFKAVSVTRNFLAQAGTPTTPTAKASNENGELLHIDLLM